MEAEAVVFDVLGYFGHFRKHYTTTSSLSYFFPPRTTICGLIAAILGRERDSYYEEFLSEACRIALKILTPLRKIIQVVNFVMTDNEAIGKFTKLGKWKVKTPAQIRQEIIVADAPKLAELGYRIFFVHEDSKLTEELVERLKGRRYCYPPCLGTSSNLARIEFVGTACAEIFKTDEEVRISTVIPVSCLQSVSPKPGLEIYREELVPADFNPDRTLKRLESYIFDRSGKSITARVNCEVFTTRMSGDKVLGTFM